MKFRSRRSSLQLLCLSHLPRSIALFASLLLACFLVPVVSNAQIQNGEFDSLDGWIAFGPVDVSISDDAYQGGSAAAVTGRTLQWHGIAQSLLGDLEAGKDYHITSQIKLLGSTDKALQILIRQTDDRGTRYYRIGEILATDSEWTSLQTGFTFQTNGVTTQLDLIFNAADPTPGQFAFDFLIDSVNIVENDWRAAADARIIQHRKRDAVLTFADLGGQPVDDLEVQVQQLTHDFGFGSTLNHLIAYNQEYGDFFKENFERATIEYASQWRATESVRSTEDYRIADISVDFAEANGIKIKGHALAYPLQEFLPDWLISLPAEEIQAELEERLTNVANRYNGRLTGWDVSNEMLEQDYLAAMLGESYRGWMFQRAREISPDAILSTNEFGVEESVLKTERYRQLIEDLLADGAEIDEIGIQSHFLHYVSPKGMELAIDELSQFGIPIYFTEFDFTNVDEFERAKGLEDFYRYAFSRPEAIGITMWGFWAGAHWRGPEASLVDLDWTINEAGRRYFGLIDEWTTSFSQQVPAEENLGFRGFHGNYLVTTLDPEETTNYHMVFLPEDPITLVEDLVVNLIDGSLTVYGTDGDDLFEYDFQQPDRFWLNGEVIMIDLLVDPQFIRFFGRGGNDKLEIMSRPRNQNFIFTGQRLTVDGESSVEFLEIESVEAVAQTLGSTVTFRDTAGDDFFTSDFDSSTMMTSETEITAENLRYVLARFNNGGSNTAWMFGSPSFTDRVFSNGDSVSVRSGSRNRRAFGFDQTVFFSSGGNDRAQIDLTGAPNTISVSPDEILHQTGGKSLQLFDVSTARLNGAQGNNDTISFSGNSTAAQTLRVFSDLLYFHGAGFVVTVNDINRSTYAGSPDGGSRVVIRDSPGDDTLDVSETAATYSNSGALHTAFGMDSVRAFSTFGGTDSATVSESAPLTILVGDWE